jgi:hypothetical protein
MAEYRGTKYSRGHSSLLAPPAPGVAWDSRIYAPPPTVPVQIDGEQLLREAVTLFVVVTLAASLGRRSALNPRFFAASPFGRRTLTIAMLTALILPVPLMGPVAFQPMWLLADSNHGIAGWGMMLVVWMFAAMAFYVGLGVLGILVRRFTHPTSDGSSPAPA